MVEKRFDHFGRRSHHVGPYPRAFEHMVHMAHGCDKDFRVKAVIVIDEADILDQLHPVKAIVIMPPNKRRDKGCACFCREQSLIGREAKRDIDHRAITGQRFAGLEAILSQWHLDADIVRNLAQDFCFFHHLFVIERNDLCRNRAIGDPADFLGHFHEITTRLVDQRGIGRHPVKQASCGQFLDVVNLGSVGEEFHVGLSLLSNR